MKSIALSLACALVAAVSMAAAASPASAGLDFTDTATYQGGTADITFNGSATLSQTASMVNGFNGGNAFTLASAGTVLTGSNATVDFSYTGTTAGGFFGFTQARYDVDVGSPAYTMVVQFGTIVGNVSLNNVAFNDLGSGLSSVYTINQSLSAVDSGRKIFIQIPSSGPGSVPLTQRDQVQAVRLTFSFQSGASTSLAIQAVVNPEPGTVALFGLGLIGLAGAVRARRRNRARAQNA
jgi:hypothetical protein